jgi:hypothetical protein
MKKRNENTELLNIAAQLKKITKKGRAKKGGDLWSNPAAAYTPLDDIKHPVSIINLQSHAIRLADSHASNVINIPARQEVRVAVNAEQMQMLDREQKNGTLNYKVLHPGPIDQIPPDVNLKCPQCTGTIDYFKGNCNKCGYKANIPPVMQ